MAILRPVELKDVPIVLDIYAPVIETSAASFEWEVPLLENFTERILKITEKFPWLVCVTDKTITGYAYAGPHRYREAYKWSAELSVYINPQFHRRGIASGLYHSLMAILRAQGYRNALAGITLPNESSVRFHESLGFKPVGIYHNVGYKFDRWHSVGWWELTLNHTKEPPSTPLNFEQVQQLNNWDDIVQSGKDYISFP